MLNQRRKILWCIAGNAITLLVVICAVVIFDDSSAYWAVGPSESLVVISVRINTPARYAVLLTFIFFVNLIQVISEDVGMPILGFTVFNPDKRHITEFGKTELQVYANTMYLISGVRSVFMVVLSITQIDIAMFSVVAREAISIYTIRLLLNEKTFATSEPATGEELQIIVHAQEVN